MKHTRAALFAGLTLTAASVGAFVPAHAADTTVTFTITSNGGLAVTAPGTGTLTDVNIAGGAATATGDLESVQVTDTRGALVANWTATVTSSDFKNGTDPNKTIPASRLTYTASPSASLGTGVPAFTPGVFGTLSPTVTYAGVGNSTVSWVPNLSLSVPATAPVGVYEAVITHSVA